MGREREILRLNCERVIYLLESVPSATKETLASTSREYREDSMCKAPSAQHLVGATYLLVLYSFRLLLS